MTETRPTSAVKIGDARHRKVLGDIDGLAPSIHDIGLLHPIVVTPQIELIAGGRRLVAYIMTRQERNTGPRRCRPK